MPHPSVLAEPAPGFLWVRLDRPERRNALEAGMARALLDIVRGDPAIPLLIDSTDPAAFCAGADLNVTDRERAQVSDLLFECYEAMITRPGPVVAVVEGPAVGGGAQLAAAADLRIAGPGGAVPLDGPRGRGLAVGAWLLPALIGRGAALDLTMTGRWVEATEALALGLVNRVEDEPGKVAAELAGDSQTRGTGVTGSVKLIAAAAGCWACCAPNGRRTGPRGAARNGAGARGRRPGARSADISRGTFAATGQITRLGARRTGNVGAPKINVTGDVRGAARGGHFGVAGRPGAALHATVRSARCRASRNRPVSPVPRLTQPSSQPGTAPSS